MTKSLPTTFTHAGRRFVADMTPGGRLSVRTVARGLDASHVEWPSDALVSEKTGCAVKFIDRGEEGEHHETIYDVV